MNIYGLLLIAVLIGGTVIVFQEQIREFERVVRTPTPPATVSIPGFGFEGGTFISGTRSGGAGGAVTPTRSPIRLPGGGAGVVGGIGDGFLGTTPSTTGGILRFSGNSRIVSGPTGTITGAQIGEVTHTINRGISDARAVGFVRNITEQWPTSPFAGYIAFLDSTQGLRTTNPAREYFVLIASSLIDTPIPISNWQVFDFREKTVYTIPEAVLTPGSSASENLSRIALRAQDVAIVSSGRSPIGFSFLVNKCTGFRSQFKTFTPSIKTDCVDPEEELAAFNRIPFSDDVCYEIVNSLSRCEAAVNIRSGASRACVDLLEDIITEEGCVAQHRNDSDFYTKEWRAFLDSDRPLWNTSESNALYLVDDQNRLVATFVY